MREALRRRMIEEMAATALQKAESAVSAYADVHK
jgi:hypothetical protein